ncbi:hypothetical protein [Bifidobacterium dentium]
MTSTATTTKAAATPWVTLAGTLLVNALMQRRQISLMFIPARLWS